MRRIGADSGKSAGSSSVRFRVPASPFDVSLHRLVPFAGYITKVSVEYVIDEGRHEAETNPRQLGYIPEGDVR